jgi:hypothetical protein
LKRSYANEEEAGYVAGKICVLQAQNVGSALDLEQEKRNFTVYPQRFEAQEPQISQLFEADQARGSISQLQRE